MKTLNYNSIKIKTKQTKQHNLLISNKDLSNICYIFEELLNLTFDMNPSYLKENIHYVYIKNKRYWTKFGIIRVAILLGNVESLEFADFIESKNID